MRTLYYLLSCGILFGLASWSYNVSYATRDAAKRVAGLERSIDQEGARIDVLRAEWAYLNRPERLAQLAEANFEVLQLVPLRPEHFAVVRDVPRHGDEINRLIATATSVAARIPQDQ